MTTELTQKEKIIKAAIKVIAAKGYNSLRTRDISNEARISYGSLYHHFKSKEDILLSIFRDTWGKLIKKIHSFDKKGDSPVGKLIKIVEFIFRNMQDDPDLIKVMIMDIPRLNQIDSPEYERLYRIFFSEIADIVAEGQKGGQINKGIVPIVAAFAIFGAVNNIIREYVFSDCGFDSTIFPVELAKDQFAYFLIPLYLETESASAYFNKGFREESQKRAVV